MAEPLLVVGLGNPGPQYAKTRHNVGAEVVELLARRHGASLRKGKERALVDEVRIEGKRVALAIPLTYMNDSGAAVAALSGVRTGKYTVPENQALTVRDIFGNPATGEYAGYMIYVSTGKSVQELEQMLLLK